MKEKHSNEQKSKRNVEGRHNTEDPTKSENKGFEESEDSRQNQQQQNRRRNHKRRFR